MAAARRLFVQNGYADTSTPALVKAAGVTRGALYHHFDDKADLFFAVAVQAAQEVADQITRQSGNPKSAVDGLTQGADAYFEAMASQGRARLLLLDAPAVLAAEKLAKLSQIAGSDELREGLAHALPREVSNPGQLTALTAILSAAFDRAALDIINGQPAHHYQRAIRMILTGLVAAQEKP